MGPRRFALVPLSAHTMTDKSESAAAANTAAAPAEGNKNEATSGTEVEKKDGSEYYWNSYAHFGIHEEMLKDEIRTKSYRNAIFHNKHLIKDKIVLDVGCGTGILSMFAASAGAEHVYSVDASSIIEQAEKIVKANGFSEVITCIKGKIEEIELPVDKVDVIISEWMGYFLFYESMLDSVLFARDKWMKPDGIMLPDKASLSIAAIEDEDYKEDKINWWNRVWGYDMSAIREVAMHEPLVDVVESRAVVTDYHELHAVDVSVVKKEDVMFKQDFKLNVKRNDYIHAFVCHFDIWFSKCHKIVHFSTGPEYPYTHWKQTVFYLNEVLMVTQGDTITGTVTCSQNAKNHRDLDILIEYQFEGKMGKIEAKQQYCLR